MQSRKNQETRMRSALIRVATIFILFDGMAMTDPASAMSGEHGRAAGAMVDVGTNLENTYVRVVENDVRSIALCSESSVAAHCRKEDLVVQAAEAAADAGATARGPDRTVHKGGPVDAVNGDWHVAEAYPLVRPTIVVIMVGEHARRPLAAPDVEATPGHDAVHAAARAQHGGRGRPTSRLWVVDFVHRRHEGRQSVALTPSDEVDAAVDRRAGKVVALCG